MEVLSFQLSAFSKKNKASAKRQSTGGSFCWASTVPFPGLH